MKEHYCPLVFWGGKGIIVNMEIALDLILTLKKLYLTSRITMRISLTHSLTKINHITEVFYSFFIRAINQTAVD